MPKSRKNSNRRLRKSGFEKLRPPKHRVPLRLLAVVGFLVLISAVIVLINAKFSLAKHSQKDVLAAITVAAGVGGPPPSQGGTITEPADNSTVSTDRITLKGTCQPYTYLQINNNGNIAGSVSCSNSAFSIEIQLYAGVNSIIAKTFDFIDQAGPDSNQINIIYTPTVPKAKIITPTVPDTGTGQGDLIVAPDKAVAHVGMGQDISWTFHLKGGLAPYAILVKWGDGNEDFSVVADAQAYVLHYSYSKPGVYTIKLTAKDRLGNVSYQEIVITVAAGSNGLANSKDINQKSGLLLNLTNNHLAVSLTILISSTVVIMVVWHRHRPRSA